MPSIDEIKSGEASLTYAMYSQVLALKRFHENKIARIKERPELRQWYADHGSEFTDEELGITEEALPMN